MSGSTIIDIAIGLVLIYLVFSLLCTAVNEWIARLLALRATGLYHGVTQLLGTELAGRFHDHVLIDVLKPDKAPVLRRRGATDGSPARYPSYISAQTFAQTIMDLTTQTTSPGMPGVAVRSALLPVPASVTRKALIAGGAAAVAAAPPPPPDPVPEVIRTLLAPVDGDGAAMEQRLVNWFDDSMDRVSGWYKRRAQAYLFVIAVIVAVGFNIDTFRVVTQLEAEPSVRAALVQQADAIVARSGGTVDTASMRQVREGIDELQHSGLTVGWDSECSPVPRVFGYAPAGHCGNPLTALLGLFVSAVALSFGAPFWFDALNKLVNVRQTGAKPDTGTAQG
ncbi:MAG: hypothetical protein ACREPM_25465, partial [Gemmatimonadaceae bacterium]